VYNLQKDGTPSFVAFEDVCFGSCDSAVQRYYMSPVIGWYGMLFLKDVFHCHARHMQHNITFCSFMQRKTLCVARNCYFALTCLSIGDWPHVAALNALTLQSCVKKQNKKTHLYRCRMLRKTTSRHAEFCIMREVCNVLLLVELEWSFTGK